MESHNLDSQIDQREASPSDGQPTIPLIQGLADLPYGPDHPLDDDGLFYLGGRPDAFANLRQIEEYDDDDEPGVRVNEIPILACDLSDIEDEGEGEEQLDTHGFLI
jgi:hypothetical protein